MPDNATLRFGLVGTGYWARETHAAGIAAARGATLAAVWGRDHAAAAAVAATYGSVVHDDFDAFLAEVDAVSFAVPPDVQPALALRAAAAGKHLLLEKPLALDEARRGSARGGGRVQRRCRPRVLHPPVLAAVRLLVRGV